jgi:hypothetical protein
MDCVDIAASATRTRHIFYKWQRDTFFSPGIYERTLKTETFSLEQPCNGDPYLSKVTDQIKSCVPGFFSYLCMSVAPCTPIATGCTRLSPMLQPSSSSLNRMYNSVTYRLDRPTERPFISEGQTRARDLTVFPGAGKEEKNDFLNGT